MFKQKRLLSKNHLVTKILNRRTYISYFLLLILVCIQTSCKKSESGCSSCKMRSSSPVKMLTAKNNYILQKFDGPDSAVDFLTYQFSDDSEMDEFIASSGLEPVKTLPATMLPVSITLFYSEKVVPDWKLDESKIIGYLCYYLESGKLKTKFFKRENGNDNLVSFLSADTRFISSNDAFAIARQAVPATQSILSFSNRDRIPPINTLSVAEFQDRVKYYSMYTIGFPDKEDGNFCPKPCYQLKGKYICVEQERQAGPTTFSCIPPIDCPKNKIDAFSAGNNINNQDAPVFNTQLRHFRDTYLATRMKGIRYISTYDFLSSKFDFNRLNAGYVIKALAIIQNDIIPVVNMLESEGNTGTILIDNDRAARMASFLDESKSYFSDAYSKELVDALITDLNTCKGQTTQYVHEFLKN